MSEAPRVAFVTLGCKVNQAESDEMAEALGTTGGCEPSEADVVVVNTCTVTGEADHKARKAVRHALSLRQQPVVVVTGCLAALDGPALGALGDRVVVEPDKARVPDRVRVHLEIGSHGLDAPSSSSPTRARVQLKVQDGCDAFCSYCIVPYARGVPRAVPAATVVAKASRLAATGVSEVVLSGINIGRYDDRGVRLSELLARVAATGVPRVRLSSIEPRDVDDALLSAAAETPAFCAHLHIPLQSGSDGVLARMGRPYDTERYAATLQRVRNLFPDIAITTDVIAGFPGETDAEFAETLAFVERMGFARLHVFRYSARAGTPAAAMHDQVSPPVRARRAAALRAAGQVMAARYADSRLGVPSELLVERVGERTVGGGQCAEGFTREYVRARVTHPQPRPGMLLTFVPGSVAADGALVGGAGQQVRAHGG